MRKNLRLGEAASFTTYEAQESYNELVSHEELRVMTMRVPILRSALCSAVAAIAFFIGVAQPSLATDRDIYFNIVHGGFAVVTGGNTHASPPYITIHGTAAGLNELFGYSSASFDQTIVFSNPNQITGGVFTFTADRDGSTLNGIYHGTSTPPDKEGYTNGAGVFTITGGTGRFAGARGHGTWTVVAQLFRPGSNPASTVLTDFVGEIEL